jgi:hypothetical protein
VEVLSENASNARVLVDAGTNARLDLAYRTAVKWYITNSSSNSHTFTIDSASVNEALKITQTGAVTIGPSSGNVNHNINIPTNGNYLRLGGSGYSAYHTIDSTAYTIGQNSNARELRIGSGDTYLTDGVSLAPQSNSWGSYSDARLKKDVIPMEYGLRHILNLRPVFYNYLHDRESKARRLGFIAQEVLDVVPEMVVEGFSDDKLLSLTTTDLIPVLVKAIQDLNNIVEKRATALESQLRGILERPAGQLFK